MIKTIESKENNRGIRSNFYTCMALDLETNEWDIYTFDFRDKIDRYIPKYIVLEILNKLE